jgi:hypothetical protein
MRHETIHDRVAGSRDHRKAKRAANHLTACCREVNRAAAKRAGVTTASYGSRRLRTLTLRHFARLAQL